MRSCSSKLPLFPKAAPQTGSPQLPKHRHKAVTPKLLCFKCIPPNSSPSKRLPKIAPQSCCRKLLPVQNFYPKLLMLPKPAPQSCSQKPLPKRYSEHLFPKAAKAPLLKFLAESCSPKPKAVIPQTNYSSMPRQSFKIVPAIDNMNFSRKLLPKIASQKFFPGTISRWTQ